MTQAELALRGYTFQGSAPRAPTAEPNGWWCRFVPSGSTLTGGLQVSISARDCRLKVRTIRDFAGSQRQLMDRHFPSIEAALADPHLPAWEAALALGTDLWRLEPAS